MSALLDILNIGSSVAGGGILGLAGTVIGRVAGYFEKKQENEFKLKEWVHEKEMLELQAQARAQETEKEIAIASVQGSYSGLLESIKAEAAVPSSYLWVNAVRALTRPVITAFLLGCLGLKWFLVGPGEEWMMLTGSLATLAATVTVWWFGDRAPRLTGQKV